jgi:hypothetical protein
LRKAAILFVSADELSLHGHFVVPLASAQQAATLTTWQYHCVNESSILELT